MTKAVWEPYCPRAGYLLVLVVGILLLVACGTTNSPTPSPTPASATPSPETTPSSSMATPTSDPTLAPTPTAESTPTPTPSSPEPLELEVFFPADGVGVEAGAVRVMGATNGTAVRVDGASVEPNSDGTFQHDLELDQGENNIGIVAMDSAGRTTSRQLVVFVVSSTSGLPFTLIYPTDGLETSEGEVPVVGVTAAEAVVGVNDVPVAVNAQGIFATTISLEEGTNFIEVVATDIEGNVRFQNAAVFYSPD